MGATALPQRMNKVVATRQASLRQLGFGNSALAVGCGQTLGLQPGSKSRSGHRVDEAVAHVRQVGQNIAIPAGREGKHASPAPMYSGS
jgi:undecaprenyl pyrophosphate phosphatase UppP